MILTGKKFVLYAAQKKITVITAKYPPSTIPVVKISASFQLSGSGDGFTRSFDIVIMVPIHHTKWSNSIRTFPRFYFNFFQRQRERKVPSFRIAMIRTMNGGKSNFQMRARSINPSCQV